MAAVGCDFDLAPLFPEPGSVKLRLASGDCAAHCHSEQSIAAVQRRRVQVQPSDGIEPDTVKLWFVFLLAVGLCALVLLVHGIVRRPTLTPGVGPQGSNRWSVLQMGAVTLCQFASYAALRVLGSRAPTAFDKLEALHYGGQSGAKFGPRHGGGVCRSRGYSDWSRWDAALAGAGRAVAGVGTWCETA